MPDLIETINAATSYIAAKDIEVIVYHHPCPDGAAGACAGWLELGDDNTIYVPYLRDNLKDDRPAYDQNLFAGKNVLFIDCAPTKQDLHSARKIAKKLMVLDHHQSAAQELQGEPGCFFIMQNSGAVLAWHYFQGLDAKLPLLYDLIQDRDLLLWNKREQSVALDTAIAELNPNFDFRFFPPYIFEPRLEALIQTGQDIIQRDKQEIERLVQLSEYRSYTCPATHKTYSIKCVELLNYKLTLQIAEILRAQENVDFCMSWYTEDNNVYRVSMRTSKPSTEVDLSIIAANFAGYQWLGGGGHAFKAGCRVKGSPLNYLQPALQKNTSTRPMQMLT